MKFCKVKMYNPFQEVCNSKGLKMRVPDFRTRETEATVPRRGICLAGEQQADKIIQEVWKSHGGKNLVWEQELPIGEPSPTLWVNNMIV